MPKSFTDEFNLDKELFEKTGALDIILDIDSNYFIDPTLLRVCKVPEFVKASELTGEYFSNYHCLVKSFQIV